MLDENILRFTNGRSIAYVSDRGAASISGFAADRTFFDDDDDDAMMAEVLPPFRTSGECLNLFSYATSTDVNFDGNRSRRGHLASFVDTARGRNNSHPARQEPEETVEEMRQEMTGTSNADEGRSSPSFIVPISDIRSDVSLYYNAEQMRTIVRNLSTGHSMAFPSEDLSYSGRNVVFKRYDIARLLLPEDHDIFHFLAPPVRLPDESVPEVPSEDEIMHDDPSLLSALDAILDPRKESYAKKKET